jgi:hypothetical protein
MSRICVATYRFAVLSLLVFVQCSDEKGTEPSPELCGDSTCGPRQHCEVARCVCDPQYAGQTCEACAPGYGLVGGECEVLAIDCASRNACGAHGTCVEKGARDVCECAPDHAGPTCAQCADGLQDNDRNGTCTPACAQAALSCESWETCNDASGTVSCGCAPHSTGRHCDECASGYYRLADGPCVKSCSGREACPDLQACKEVEGKDAACTCPLGASGSDCTSCAPGFAGAGCTRAPTPGHLLLGSKDMNWSVLYDYDPQTKVFTALRSQVPGLLTSDSTRHELWGGEPVSSGWTFGRYDLANDTVTPLSSSLPFNTTATFDSKRRAVFWVAPDNLDGLAGTLTRLEVESGAQTSVAHVAIRSSDYLAYDAKNDRLLGTQWDQGLVMVSIDPNTGALATLGKPAFQTNGTNPRLTVDAAGQVYLLASVPRPAEERVRDMLLGVFARLGVPSFPATAPVALTRTYYVDPSKPVVLIAASSSGPEVVAYDSYGGLESGGAAGPMPIQLMVKNPDAVVSLTSFNTTLRIQIPAEAQFKTLFVHGGGAHTLELAPGFQGAAGSIVMIGAKLQADALEALSPAVRAYTTQAVQDRRATPGAYFDDNDHSAPLWLVRVDTTTQAATLVHRFEGEAARALTVY